MSINKLYKNWIWLSLFSMVIVLNIKAQDPYFNHYTEDIELPSNQVYGMVQDSNDILYMATDRGLVQFDGYSFKTFTISDGLENNCILRISKDRNKRIWLTSLQNTCNYIENGKLHTALFNNALNAEDSHEHFVQQIFVTPENEILIIFNYPGLYKVDKDSTLVQLKDHLNEVEGANICIFKTENGYYWDQIKNPKVDPNGKTSVKFIDNKCFITTSLIEESAAHRKELISLSDDEFIFSYNRKLFHFKGNKLLYKPIVLDQEILSLYFDDKDKDIWVGLNNGSGAYRFSEGTLLGKSEKYLNGRSISSILRDHEGNYWFSDKNSGVFRTNNLDLQAYTVKSSNPEDNLITSMAATNSALYFGTQSGRLHKLTGSNGEYTIEEMKRVPQNGAIRNIDLTSKGSLLVFSQQLTEITPNGKLIGFKEKFTFPYAFLELNENTSLLSKTPGISKIQNRKEVFSYDYDKGFMKVRQIFKDSKETLWLSSQPYGIFTWKYGDSIPTTPARLAEFQHYNSLSFAEIQGNMILSPAGKGIVIVMPDSLLNITKEKNNLSSDIVDCLFVDGDSILWVGTNNGINKIPFGKTIHDIPVIDNISTQNGLPSNRVNCLESYDDQIWAATGRGLIIIPRNYNICHTLKKPVIESLTINNKEPHFLPSDTVLSKDHPFNLKFKFKTISFYQPHDVYYHYYMFPVDKSWSSTKDMEIRYPGLKHGNYTLYVKAMSTPVINEKGIPENLDSFSVLNITIPKKTHETLSFKILVFSLAVIAIAIIILMVVKTLKKREQIKLRLLDAEKKALLAQMNPHFIFNSLNSIQHYIIQEDAENANLYLAKFAQLIRKILDNSKKRQISLREEIDIILLYLNLEKLRFEDNFEFELNKSKDLDQNAIMIPPMLIQPFVENAIWHGLMPLLGKGHLTIHFERNKNKMNISIEDNGVGRKQSAKKKRIKGYTQTGLINVNERIFLLNKIENGNISCLIIDLANPDGTAAGTRVELTIPIID